jgi:hypothetical protein
MNEKAVGEQHSDMTTPAGLAVEPAFILLFSIRLHGAFDGFGAFPAGIAPLPPDQSNEYVMRLAEFETKLLGEAFLEARRIARWPLGRIALYDLDASKSRAAPAHADVYLLTHKSGMALWEVWLPAPTQSFDAFRWIGWLDPEVDDGLIARLWRVLGSVNLEIAGNPSWSGLYFPLIMLRAPQHPVETIVERHGSDLIHLLFLDRSRRPLKALLVEEELARDYCVRESGMTLLGRRSGLDLHGREDAVEDIPPAGLPQRSVLPFLITLELLLLERAVLQSLYERLVHRMPRSVEELLVLKQKVLDELEEYYGAITIATRFSDEVIADGERLLGLGNLYDAVIDRLETVSFEITMRYQKRTTLLQFWLTIVFGATEIGFIASSIATWYYHSELWAVLAWTIGVSLVTGLGLVAVLRGKME